MQATPATFRMLVDAGWRGRRDLRVLCGGEAFPPELPRVARPRRRGVEHVRADRDHDLVDRAPLAAARSRRSRSVEPIDNTAVYVLTALREPVAPGAIGEIYIGGDGVARGYRARPS